MTTPSVDGLEFVDLEAEHLPEAIGVLARGMRDNPMHAAVFGDDPEERRRTLERLFGELTLNGESCRARRPPTSSIRSRRSSPSCRA